MTAKKAAASKAQPPRRQVKVEPEATSDGESSQPTTEMTGEAYQVGYYGVASDSEDYSVSAEVARLSEA